MGKKMLILILILLTGCSITSKTTLDITDYSKIKVISLDGEGECAGTEAEPCKAIAKFEVTETITINPMQLLEIDSPVKQVKGYNKKLTFEPGHDYTLKYEVLKLNPTDTLKWKFAGVE